MWRPPAWQSSLRVMKLNHFQVILRSLRRWFRLPRENRATGNFSGTFIGKTVKIAVFRHFSLKIGHFNPKNEILAPGGYQILKVQTLSSRSSHRTSIFDDPNFWVISAKIAQKFAQIFIESNYVLSCWKIVRFSCSMSRSRARSPYFLIKLSYR